jgi:hypothetical protein
LIVVLDRFDDAPHKRVDAMVQDSRALAVLLGAIAELTGFTAPLPEEIIERTRADYCSSVVHHWRASRRREVLIVLRVEKRSIGPVAK